MVRAGASFPSGRRGYRINLCCGGRVVFVHRLLLLLLLVALLYLVFFFPFFVWGAFRETLCTKGVQPSAGLSAVCRVGLLRARATERERKRGRAKAILREREQDTRHWTTEPSDLEARQWPPLGRPVGRLVCCYASYREGCRIHLDDSTNRSHRCVRVNVGVCVGRAATKCNRYDAGPKVYARTRVRV